MSQKPEADAKSLSKKWQIATGVAPKMAREVASWIGCKLRRGTPTAPASVAVRCDRAPAGEQQKVSARTLLKQYEVRRRPRDLVVKNIRPLVVLLVVAVVTIIALIDRWPSYAVPAAIAIAAAFFGYFQFLDVRQENSVDRFYERLRVTNQRLDSYPATWKLIGPIYDVEKAKTAVWRVSDNKGDASGRPEAAKPIDLESSGDNVHLYACHMYVYSELDNLEYAYVKYRAGHMSAEQFARSIRLFRGRCAVSRDFETLVELICSQSDRWGYDQPTKALATDICKMSCLWPVDCELPKNAQGRRCTRVKDEVGPRALELLPKWATTGSRVKECQPTRQAARTRSLIWRRGLHRARPHQSATAE